MRAAVFLDKDGTLIDDVPYNVDPAKIRLADHAIAGLKRLHAAGFSLIVVTNQSGVARGLFAEAALIAVETRLRELLAAEEISLDGFLYCPHHPSGSVPRYAVVCECRKPRPGMIQTAASDHRIDLTRSWMVGDLLNDVEAGHRAGCRSILVDVGRETEWNLTPQRTPFAQVPHLDGAADVILGRDQG